MSLRVPTTTRRIAVATQDLSRVYTFSSIGAQKGVKCARSATKKLAVRRADSSRVQLAYRAH